MNMLAHDQLPSQEIAREHQRIAILDAGAQYVDLIDKACWRLGYAADILPLETPFSDIEHLYGGFIISGGPANSHAENAPMPDKDLWKTKKGVLGICYGQQAMTLAFGGKVETGLVGEDGGAVTTVDTSHPLFNGVKKEIRALFTHGDFVTEMPEGFATIGEHELTNGQRVVSAIARDNFAAVQFHPEVFDETPHGYDIFRGFLEKMCDLAPDIEMLEQRANQELENRKAAIAEQAGERHVIAFASGGVDSTVATKLAAEVIDPSKLHIFYFDNGFMRDEDDNVIAMLQAEGINVQAIDATETFEQASTTLDGITYGPLIEVSDPQIKRKIIGKKFAELKDEVASNLGLDTSQVMLLQGTNAADRIESGKSRGGTQTEQIKEHHNQVKEIEDLQRAGLLIEPLNDLHKDEIRRLGEQMNLPEEVVWRQPFPGPGNAIRILCARNGEYQQAPGEIEAALGDYISSALPNIQLKSRLLPTRSVGVGGDARSYVMPAALQGPPDWLALEKLAQDIPANFRGHINRVVYALGPAPLSSLGVTETTLKKPERLQLRHADHIVFEEMRDFGLLKHISQCPVVLLPLSFGHESDRSIVLRPITTSTYLTAKAMIPGRDVDPLFIAKTAERILSEVPGIGQVFLELTNKPPATTEWE